MLLNSNLDLRYISQAIEQLSPSAVFHIQIIETGFDIDIQGASLTETQIITKAEELQAAYETAQYSRNRATAYPNIADQLDMLYHDIKSGALDSGNWIAAIEAVKTQYPKP